MAASQADPHTEPVPSSTAVGQTGLTNEIEDSTLLQLLSEDQGALLDRIDQLRVAGLQLPLPQIIVCGDQSSGKSSVLEAISRVSFPKGERVCTTFPIELVLRRGAAWGPHVEIKPAATRTAVEKDRLTQPLLSTNDKDSFDSVFKDAKKLLQSDGAEDSYSEDILHIEVHNPAWPPLTLVDLPGIIHSETKRQAKGDADKVKSLVRSYMDKPNTIILAVISAGYDPEIQGVLQMAGKVDPGGRRTLGIITNPDRIQRSVEEEENFLRYANNEEHRFELGWHVVKNLAPESRGRGLDERDREEAAFFSQGVWRKFPKPEHLGIGALRTRLSEILMDITLPALPGILSKIRTSLTNCENELNRLGEPRDSHREQLAYINDISNKFNGLLSQAIRGDYAEKSFFKPGLPPTDARRLRAAVDNLNEEFADVMYAIGHKHVIPGSDESTTFIPKYSTHYDNLPLPEAIESSTYFEYVERLAAQNRGGVSPGIPNPRLISELFRLHSEPWEDIALAHIDNVWNVAYDTLRSIANYVSPSETADAIARYRFEDEMQEKRKVLTDKLQELLRPYRRDYLTTYHPKFFENIISIRETQPLISESSPSDRFLNIDKKTSDVALSYMLAHYNIAIVTFIDNVATLAIEQCLIDSLPNIFNPSQVPHMNEDELERLASESDGIRKKRLDLREEETKLRDALKIVSRSKSRVKSSGDAPIPQTSLPSRSKPKGAETGSTPSYSSDNTATSTTPVPIITKTSSLNISASQSPSHVKASSSSSNVLGNRKPATSTGFRSRSAEPSPRPNEDWTEDVPSPSLSTTSSKASTTETFNFNKPPQPISSQPSTTGYIASSSDTVSKDTLGSGGGWAFGKSKPSASSSPFGSGSGFGGFGGFGLSKPPASSSTLGSSGTVAAFGSSGGFGSSSAASNSQSTSSRPPYFGALFSSTPAATSATSPFGSSKTTVSTSQPSIFSQVAKPPEASTSQGDPTLLFGTTPSSKDKGRPKSPFSFGSVGGVDKPSSSAPNPDVDTSYRRQGENISYKKHIERDQSGEGTSIAFECLWAQGTDASAEEVRFQYYVDRGTLWSEGTFIKSGSLHST